MPELPEVENVRRGLQPMIEGARIRAVQTSPLDLRFAYPDNFTDRLRGRTIGAVGRRAKYLTLSLDSGEILLSHLGMTGTFRKSAPANPPRIHDHLVLSLEKGGEEFDLVYNDVRRFGFVGLAAEGEDHPFLRDLGSDPLSEDFDGEALAAIFAGRRAAIKPALLDQRSVAGLGNIYVCEALFRGRVAPTRPAGSLSKDEYAGLALHIREILLEAIEAGGSTLKDYRKADGSRGAFQDRFAVYGREGAPCPRCDSTIVRIIQAQRSTFHCPTCQH